MKRLIFISAIVLVCFSCTKERKHNYVIGVSQCSEDYWRETVNREMVLEATFQDGLEVRIRSVKDDSEQQIRDIESFLKDKVDLLVVSPNESAALTPIVTAAYQKGTPVILLDRKTGNDNYTAFVGADNYDLAYQLGEYVIAHLPGGGSVMEVRGLKGSTADYERHQGFMDALSSRPDIRIVCSAYCNFLQENARDSVLTMLNRLGDDVPDLIFAMNDAMAIGANEAVAISRKPRPFIIGIDALDGPGSGIEAIRNQVIDASFMYPTGGETVIDVASRILTGKPYERENTLGTAVVDRNNIHIISLQNEQIRIKQNDINELNNRLFSLSALHKRQRLMIFVSWGLVLLSLLLLSVTLHSLRVRKRLSRQLEEASQAKLTFFTDVSHDFKTPLTLILDPVEQLLERDDLPETARQSMLVVRRNSYRLLDLVTQVLDFRKYENGKMEPRYTLQRLDVFLMEINQVFESILDKKRIQFDFRTDMADYLIPFDRDKVEKIYVNLLSNALKFTPEGGRINVSLHRFEDGGKGMWRMRVFNSGSYIPPEEIKMLFERFYHKRNEDGSSGIGLSLTQALVRLLSGEISVSSAENDGTAFTVTLPVPPEESAEQSGAQDDAMLFSKHQALAIDAPKMEKTPLPDLLEGEGKPTVLVIEDNPDLLATYSEMLGDEYHVLLAQNGQEGLEKTETYLPDLIVCDIMMPGISGLDVCRRIKGNGKTRDIPIIILSAWNLNDHRIAVYESGADAFIAKPFNPRILKTRIRALLDKRNLAEEPVPERKSLAGEQRDLLDRLKEYVETHLQQEISIDDVAEHLNMSRTKLYREFHRISDLSPADLINMFRLRKAASLMLDQRLSVSEAAFATGFSSSSYFTKVFTKFYRMKPSDYIRKNNLNDNAD